MTQVATRLVDAVEDFLVALSVAKPSPLTLTAYRRDLPGVARRVATARPGGGTRRARPGGAGQGVPAPGLCRLGRRPRQGLHHLGAIAVRDKTTRLASVRSSPSSADSASSGSPCSPATTAARRPPWPLRPASTRSTAGLLPEDKVRAGRIMRQNLALSGAVLALLVPLGALGFLGLAAVVATHELAEVAARQRRASGQDHANRRSGCLPGADARWTVTGCPAPTTGEAGHRGAYMMMRRRRGRPLRRRCRSGRGGTDQRSRLK
jgi:hypothetical protein